MSEKGWGDGLVSRIKNRHSGRQYLISTAKEIGKNYWSTNILNSKFFGLWADFSRPLFVFIRNKKEDAHAVHSQIKEVVFEKPDVEWMMLFPSSKPPEGYSDEAKEILKKKLGYIPD